MAALLAVAPAAAAGRYNDVQLADPAQERAAKALMTSIRCVVCRGQSIADSNADIAGDMRGEIRERIAAGESPESIRAWFIQHYGDWVSFQPRFTEASAPLWLIPALSLLFGVALARPLFRKRR
ncbi:cytochrome c-type biogenesis protein [Sandarakinorhabdus oryzae]|uniref:cytochrome c-type biogenesis protein n=1 Tax=Sandarakinorhabdus oryzae TaxID=2675220 RepID=UPI001F223ED1|nr:cytochrome c-type biogenesis protein [Sandarakinorhabdus oryzae]